MSGNKTLTGDSKMTVSVTNKDFGYAVKFLKKFGYTFDSATKTWSGSRDVSFLTDEGYAVEEKGGE